MQSIINACLSENRTPFDVAQFGYLIGRARAAQNKDINYSGEYIAAKLLFYFAQCEDSVVIKDAVYVRIGIMIGALDQIYDHSTLYKCDAEIHSILKQQSSNNDDDMTKDSGCNKQVDTKDSEFNIKDSEQKDSRCHNCTSPIWSLLERVGWNFAALTAEFERLFIEKGIIGTDSCADLRATIVADLPTEFAYEMGKCCKNCRRLLIFCFLRPY